jgi:pimeloyl-ACP methyl ester carboxylesterase
MTRIYKSAEGERAVRERYLEILKHWPVPNEQRRVPTREGETFVVVCGDADAPPLLLLHGSMANSAMWMGDVAAWAAQFRVYAVDMIGDAGLSAASRPPLASEAHALWLDDVMQSLSLPRASEELAQNGARRETVPNPSGGTRRALCASMVGVSLGGWLALDYATRRPERVQSLVVLCPGGVGAQKISIVFKTIPLRMLGRWGKRKAAELVLGRAPANPSPAVQYFMQFMALIHKNFRPRMVKLPIFSDEALRRLKMPVMAILGGKDVLLDSTETKGRLEHNVPHAEIRYLPEAGHLIPKQTTPILEFLLTRALLRDTILRGT